jgi:glycosyltransferase involved in cell wall biosynthesis
MKYMQDGCSHCPQLGPAKNAGDLAAENFKIKREAYPALDMFLLTPSRHEEKCISKSILLGKFHHDCISNFIDTNIFAPMPKVEAKTLFSLPMNKRVLVFSAADVERRNKGYNILLQTLELLYKQGAQHNLCLLVLGRLNNTELPQGYECCLPGFIEDKKMLAAAYSAADVFVNPSRQESFGLVTLEALACGTPGIAFKDTSAEEIILDGVTGYLTSHPGFPLEEGAPEPGRHGAYKFIKPGCIENLASAITKLLELPEGEYAEMRRACREHVLAKFTPELAIYRHLQLYRRRLGLPQIDLL